MAKRITITVASHTLISLRTRSCGWARCEACGGQVETAPLVDINPDPDSTRAAIEVWARSIGLHCLKSESGALLVCLNSLLTFLEKPTTRGLPPPRPTRKEEK
jgi:hypothetical protein